MRLLSHLASWASIGAGIAAFMVLSISIERIGQPFNFLLPLAAVALGISAVILAEFARFAAHTATSKERARKAVRAYKQRHL